MVMLMMIRMIIKMMMIKMLMMMIIKMMILNTLARALSTDFNSLLSISLSRGLEISYYDDERGFPKNGQISPFF